MLRDGFSTLKRANKCNIKIKTGLLDGTSYGVFHLHIG